MDKYLKAAWMVVKKEPAPRTHSLTELADGLHVPADLRPSFAYLNPDYTTARYPDAANGVPYEVYDRATAKQKVATVEKVSVAQALDADEKGARFRREVLPRLVEQYRPEHVIVFGSRACGDALKDSDLDVLIVTAGRRTGLS